MSVQGATATILATGLASALLQDGVKKDMAPFGPATSAWLRELATDYCLQAAELRLHKAGFTEALDNASALRKELAARDETIARLRAQEPVGTLIYGGQANGLPFACLFSFKFPPGTKLYSEPMPAKDETS